MFCVLLGVRMREKRIVVTRNMTAFVSNWKSTCIINSICILHSFQRGFANWKDATTVSKSDDYSPNLIGA